MRKQFRNLISPEDAEAIVAELEGKKTTEEVRVSRALGRTAAEDVFSGADVPPFGRSLMDGYAVLASDTYGAEEDSPVELSLSGEVKTGEISDSEVIEGECLEIATGAPLPEGSNAVVMVEDTEREDQKIYIKDSVSPGENVFDAASDVARGEKILSRGTEISPTDIGLLASTGLETVEVYGSPRVGVISTGPELAPPGSDLDLGEIYDINSDLLASGVKEAGGKPANYGIVPDEEEALKKAMQDCAHDSDLVLTSGGTSAGPHDLVYRLLEKKGEILAHGVKIKPGKPTIFARFEGVPFFGLPGNPSSAYAVFRRFVDPMIREMSGTEKKEKKVYTAEMAQYVRSEGGRTEQKYVGLVERDENFRAYPVGKASGAVTLLSEADGFVEIPEGERYIDEGETVEVNTISSEARPPQLLSVGSNCLGMGELLNMIDAETRNLNRGSMNGVRSVAEGIADLAGIHIWSPEGYNIPFLDDFEISNAKLLRGYDRRQGWIVEKGNPLGIDSFSDLIEKDLRMVNRNGGSGTRLLIDHLLEKTAGEFGLDGEEMKRNISGYQFETRSHNAVAAAVKTGKADVGLGIKTVADVNELGFVPLRKEKYDILVREDLLETPEGGKLKSLLSGNDFRDYLSEKSGLEPSPEAGEIILEL